MSRWIMIDNTSPYIAYEGAWTAYQGSQFDGMGCYGAPFNNTLHGTASNSSVSFKFHEIGSAVIVYGTQQYNSTDLSTPVTNPSWECFIDGLSGPIVAQPGSAVFGNNIPLCAVSGLQDGSEHTITTRARVEGDRTFWFDYVRYLPSASVPLDNATLWIDAGDSQIQYSTGWESASALTNNENGFPKVVNTAGPALEFSFVGNMISWYAASLNPNLNRKGSASFSIDNGTLTTFGVFDHPTISNAILPSNILLFHASIPSSPTQKSHKLQVAYDSTSKDTQVVQPLSLDHLIVQNGTGVGPFGPQVPDGSTSPPSNNAVASHKLLVSQLGIILGNLLGGLVLIGTVLSLVWYYHHLRQQRCDMNTTIHGTFERGEDDGDAATGINLSKRSTLVRPYTLSRVSIDGTDRRPRRPHLKTDEAGVTPTPRVLGDPPRERRISCPPSLSPPSNILGNSVRDEDSGIRLRNGVDPLHNNVNWGGIVVLPPEYTPS
ncbi:hypothetical protein JR316_0006416 [Psilocybe cubensis]|uniref:Uncharacterized protein n=1 Tax=Psilocybe cubensis TaxID=181762 RepID=A0ACB8H315_PSICU|nr:hypothetical protein JR316_0006416 [Psilocybe cubensis]KAH9481886.1 hypothetical protein JR316_0006416 [Psilocybe cubensis]